MNDRTLAYLAIGSNIAPYRNIPRCLHLLRGIRDTRVGVASSWYLTRPWGVEAQANFVNLVVGLTTGLAARALLAETQAIEARLERVRGLKNGPRTIDLDLLLYGDAVLEDPDCRIPHPGLLVRDFMLVPLVEVAPGLRLPGDAAPLAERIGELRYRQIIEQLPPTMSDDSQQSSF